MAFKPKLLTQWKKNITKEQNTTTTDYYLPPELHQQILLFLPAKSLLKFKSVSKTWRSLIQSPPFIHTHRLLHSRDFSDHLLFSPHSPTHQPSHSSSLIPTRFSPSPSTDHFNMTSTPLDHMLPPEITRLEWPRTLHGPDNDPHCPWRVQVRALGPLSNGLYCVVSNLCRDTDKVCVATGKIALCNPATRDYKFTNPFPSRTRSILLDIARHPCRVNYGFGGVPGDYKVVVVVATEPSSLFFSVVYSQRRGRWETLVDYESGKRHSLRGYEVVAGMVKGNEVMFPHITGDLEVCPQRFLNGCWHWMAVGWDSEYAVLSFDLSGEAFKYIGAPKTSTIAEAYESGMAIRAEVLVLRDHLAAIYSTVYEPWEENCIDVWMMMEYGVEESWTKIYAVVACSGILERLVGISSSTRDDDGSVCIERIFFEDRQTQLISCDAFETRKHDEHGISRYLCWNNVGISAYSETLEPVTLKVEDSDVVELPCSSCGRQFMTYL